MLLRRIALLSCVLIHIAPKVLMAQVIAVGTRVGSNYATLSTGDSEMFERRRGHTAGVFISGEVSSWLSLHQEISWIQKGAERTIPAGDRVRVVYDFVELSSQLRLLIPVWSPVRLHLLGGPTVSVRTECYWERARQGQLVHTGPCERTFLDGEVDVRSYAFGLLTGAGISYEIGRWTPLVEFRYGHGLTSAIADLPSEAGDIWRDRSYSVSLGIAYSFESSPS